MDGVKNCCYDCRKPIGSATIFAVFGIFPEIEGKVIFASSPKFGVVLPVAAEVEGLRSELGKLCFGDAFVYSVTGQLPKLIAITIFCHFNVNYLGAIW
jgi:hypothetical protein